MMPRVRQIAHEERNHTRDIWELGDTSIVLSQPPAVVTSESACVDISSESMTRAFVRKVSDRDNPLSPTTAAPQGFCEVPGLLHDSLSATASNDVAALVSLTARPSDLSTVGSCSTTCVNGKSSGCMHTGSRLLCSRPPALLMFRGRDAPSEADALRSDMARLSLARVSKRHWSSSAVAWRSSRSLSIGLHRSRPSHPRSRTQCSTVCQLVHRAPSTASRQAAPACRTCDVQWSRCAGA